MAGFGGAVKLSGESEYMRALKQITQNLKEVSSEMKVVSSQFDKNDNSTEALNARSDVLNKTLAEQKEKLKVLSAEYAELAPRVAQEAEKHKELVAEYNNEKAKLQSLGETLGDTSDEYKAQQAKVADLAVEVAKSTSANDANEKSLSDLRIQMNNTEAEINKTTKSIDELGTETEESGKDAKKASEGYTVFKGVLADLASSAIKACLNGLKQMAGALIDVGKQAVASYADFEQLEGGVKKIFGDEDAERVMDNAQRAFETAGMSANQYMETVTNFSASLIQGLGGDTAQAVEYADMAIADMADNANTYGTSIESIMNAYQGFAKGNFTMLDNLKLGYGGTKTEMLRLVKDAGVVEQSVKSLDDVTFDQMIQAIHIMQEQMNITGTTATEASQTISGSMSAMRASWQNILTGIADDNADFGQLVDDFMSTLIDENGGGVIGRLMPRIKTVIEGIGKMVTVMIPQLVTAIVPIIQSMTPTLVTAVGELLNAIVALLPTIIPIVAQLVPEICQTLVSLLPEIVDVGMDFVMALIDGISEMLPQLLQMLPQIVIKIAQGLLERLPDILNAGLKLMGGLIAGIVGAVGEILKAVKNIGLAIWNALKERVSDMVSAGTDMVKGLWQGLTNSLSWIKNKIKGWVGDVLKFIKKLFGISSPSKVFRDQIGANLALGIGEGFSEEMDDVAREMADSIPSSFDVSPTINSGVRFADSRAESDMVSAFKEALSEMKIILDDEVAGRFVETTVARAIYAY